MRKSMVAMLAVTALVASGCLMFATAELNGQAPGGDKKAAGQGPTSAGLMMIRGLDAAELFDLLAKGRDFFLISETRTLREPLTQYAKEKKIENGQVSRKQFLDFHTQYKARMEAPGGGKKGPMGPGAGQPGGFGGGGFGGGAGGFGGQPGGGAFGPMTQIAPKPMTWEYRVLNRGSLMEIGKENFEAGLNLVGAEGWELIGIETNKANTHTYIFRRPGANKPRADAKPAIVIDEDELAGDAKVLRAAKLPGTSKPGAGVKPPVQGTTFEQALAEVKIRVYRMQHANAVEVGRMIDELMRSGKQDTLRVIGDPNTNQLLVRGNVQAHLDIEALLQRLDVPTDAGVPPGQGKKGGRSPFGN